MKIFTLMFILASTMSCSIYQSPGRECLVEGTKCSVIDDSVEIQSIYPSAICVLKTAHKESVPLEQDITSQSLKEHRGQEFLETISKGEKGGPHIHLYTFVEDLNAHAYCDSQYDSEIEFEQNYLENTHLSLEVLHSKLITKYRSID